jgi:hypothetical protein
MILWMRDQEQCSSPAQRACERALEVFRVKGTETFIENDEGRTLQESSGEEEAATLTVGELPTGLTNLLLNACRHAPEKVTEAQLGTQLLGISEILWFGWPASPHEEVEGEATGKDMILMKLRCHGHPSAPTSRIHA